MAFDGKRIVITGAGRGLGAALAIVLADKGADLLLTGRSRENLTAIAEAIKREAVPIYESKEHQAA